jgi:Zn ribbon nucleic-acid-binding protein
MKCGYCGSRVANPNATQCPICGEHFGAQVVHIDQAKMKTHFAAAAMCLRCNHRWFGLMTKETNIFKLECPSCEYTESFATLLPPEYLEEHVPKVDK